MKLIIGYLYGDLMNIYGDTGNIITLQKRCQWRNIDVEVKLLTLNSELKTHDCDLYFFGGGQDQQQIIVASDLESSGKGKVLRQEIDRGVPLLAICGGYQLLGEYYAPFDGPKLEGVGIFPAYTLASHNRMIGNIIIEPGDMSFEQLAKLAQDSRLKTQSLLVGFENHSGKTYLDDKNTALGQVETGFGNNGEDSTEGCRYKNAIGCYMHGSLLPKNPELTDWLIKTALEIKYGKEIQLKPLDDSLEQQAHDFIVQKFT